MAENKKSFVLYTDQKELFNKLPDEVAGKLIKMIYSYVSDENPNTEDILLQIAFEPIKAQLKRDLKDWEQKKTARSEAGKKGMENRWKDNKAITKDNNVISDITKITVNVNDNVNDNDNVTVININNKMPKAEDVGELAEIKIGAAIELLKITKQQDISPPEILAMWEVFKKQNCTGSKYYADHSAIESHFINWLKTQKFESGNSKNRIRNQSELREIANRTY